MEVQGLEFAGLCIILIAFVAEYADSTLGMGYGTTLTPVLLLMGFAPLQVVPAVLLSELVTGLLAGVAHHAAGNADLKPAIRNGKSLRKNVDELGWLGTMRHACPRHLKVVLVMAFCSIFGSLAAVFVAVRLPRFYLKLYIGLMVAGIGVYLLLRGRKARRFSWRRITFLGVIASFNKGMSGGGYGPVVTGGQILSGVNGKTAVAVTSLAEGLTCAAAFAAYFFTQAVVDYQLFPYLCVGAVLSVPLSVLSVRRLSPARLQWAISVLVTGLGTFSLVRLFV